AKPCAATRRHKQRSAEKFGLSFDVTTEIPVRQSIHYSHNTRRERQTSLPARLNYANAAAGSSRPCRQPPASGIVDSRRRPRTAAAGKRRHTDRPFGGNRLGDNRAACVRIATVGRIAQRKSG